MTRLLDPSHTWGTRPDYERTEPDGNRFRVVNIPCCLACFADGRADNPGAFEPCPRTRTPRAVTA